MKALIISTFLLISGFSLYNLFQSPEKYLKNKTEYLIKLSAPQNLQEGKGLISKVTKVSKFIHYDVQVKMEYEAQVYKASSLNEFRSLLSAYFRYNQTKNQKKSLEYENLTVKIKKDKKIGIVKFDIFFNSSKENIQCQTVLEWLKEKKWFVKKIEVQSCKKSS